MIGSSQGGQPAPPRQDIYRSPFYVPGAVPPPPTQQQNITAKASIRPPRLISDASTESSVNNVLAQGYRNADQRFQMKQLDRAGFSRGKGAQYIAGQQGVQAMGKAAADAADVRSQDQLQNSQMQSDYERAREMEAQSLAMTQHGFNEANNNLAEAQQAAAMAAANAGASSSLNNWTNQMAQQQAALQLMLSLLRQN